MAMRLKLLVTVLGLSHKMIYSKRAHIKRVIKFRIPAHGTAT